MKHIYLSLVSLLSILFINNSFAQTSCTPQTPAAVLQSFSDNAAPSSITPSAIRNFVCSVFSTGTGLESSNLGAIVVRSGDKLYVGKNTNVNDGNIGPTNTVKDWAEQFWPNSTSISMIAADAQLAGIGLMGATRSSDGAPSGYAIGVTGLFLNDIAVSPTGSPTAGAGGYFEGVHPVGAYGSNWTHGVEINAVELNNGTVNGVTFPVVSHPYSTNPNGMTTALILASGGARAGAQPVTTALRFTPNNQPFETGIEFRINSLALNGGFYEAMAMPGGSKIDWYGSDNIQNAYIVGGSGAPGLALTGLTLQNGGVTASSTANASFTLASTGTSSSEIFFQNGGANKYIIGTDINNNFILNDVTQANVAALGIIAGMIYLGEPSNITKITSTALLMGPGTANATNATTNFIYTSAVAGLPTGVPASAAAGWSAIVNDTTDHKLCWYEQPVALWKCVTGT